jgi:hypothetical protein
MRIKLDQRGAGAFEFGLVAVAFFTLIFAIIDLGRYLITVQSLETLAGAGARAIMIHSCYVDNVLKKLPPSGCPADPLPTSRKDELAPFLVNPALNVATGSSPITVTASSTFSMLVPLWPATMDSPSVTTKIPY